MDRNYIEEHLSAYLDGELAPKEMREFERDIQSYPDLFAELQTLQRLNKVAQDSEVALPDDTYFDKLAGRIDSRLKRELQPDRSKVINFLLERRKTVAIISSVAAMFLIAVIGMNMFGPGAKKYPSEIRTIELKPAIVTTPKKDSVALWPQYEPTVQPPPIVEEESKKTEPTNGSRSKVAKNEADQTKSAPVITTKPTQLQGSVVEPVSLPPDTTKSEAQIVIVERNLLQPIPKEKSAANQLQSLSGPSSGATASNEASDMAKEADIVLRVDSVTLFTETILPPSRERRMANSAEPIRAPIQPDTARLSKSSGRDWSVYAQVFKQLNQGMYASWKLIAPASQRDSLQAWKDSLTLVGPGLWYAEQSFRSMQQLESSWEDYQRWRAYFDFYLADLQTPDRGLWEKRIIVADEILERHLGKIYQEKK